MSDAKPIHEALADVMADVTAVGKGDKNDFHKFMFRGIDRILNSVGPVLRAHRVVVVPRLMSLDSRDTTTEKGKTAREVTVTVAYVFHGPAGDSLECIVPGEAQDVGDKAVSKAMSVAYRTALIQALSIPTNERDPDAQSYTRAEGVVIGWQRRIREAAEKKGWSFDKLAEDFYEWSMGGDIRDADEKALSDYHKTLVPPTKMQRQPVDSKADGS